MKKILDLEVTSPKDNHLLAFLPDEVYLRLSPHLDLVEMPLGKVLYESGEVRRLEVV